MLRIKDLREDKNLLKKDVAEFLNISQTNYSKYELGKILIHVYPLIEFAKHYKVSIDWLCGKTKEKN